MERRAPSPGLVIEGGCDLSIVAWPGQFTSSPVYVRYHELNLMKLLSRLFSRKPVPKTEKEVAALIEGFANGTGGRCDWDYFISARFEDERIKWAQTECFKVEKEFPRSGPVGWCNEKGLERLRAIAAELRYSKER
jgi:hypothetical protein